MAERTVLGVDFSGAGEDTDIGKTWVTMGRFDGKTLTIDDCYPVSRDGLRTLLKDQPSDSVVAMDFPFGIPMEFIQYLGIGATTMSTVWSSISSDDKDLAWFKSKCQEFGKHSKRSGDKYYTKSISPLNLRMIPMTFCGMSMLDKLWKETNCQVPPLEQDGRNGLTLLEVMPGAALRIFGLPFEKYKDGDNDTARRERRATREKILGELDGASQIQLEMSDIIRNKCIDNRGGDALDSLVAAVVAAKWAKNKSDFLVPSGEIEVARLEGWIYTPLPSSL